MSKPEPGHSPSFQPKMALPLLAALSLLGGCRQPASEALPGYAEADYVRVAAPFAGRLTKLPVARGAEVQAGAPLFELDRDSEAMAVDQAQAQLTQSEAQAANLAKGKRADELAALAAQVDAARANLRLAEEDLQRQQGLARRGFVSDANLDALRERVRANRAQLEQGEANLRVGRLAAREDERHAAQAGVDSARAVLAQNAWKRDQKSVQSPLQARVEDTLYRVGEWVPAGSPVVSLLAPDGIKLRFYVPQAQLSKVSPGQTVSVQCDACKQAIQAKVSFVASQAEFTPPVIYSVQNRSRLVYLVEARPMQTGLLRPGQPVDVSLGAQP